MIRVLLVDDHQLVREGLTKYLETEEDIEIVGQAADGATAERMAATLRPDVILMDLMLPDFNGIEATRRCLVAHPACRVIILTSMPDDEHVVPALQAGALSYLLKDVAAEELAAAIRQAHQGQPTLHPLAATRIMRAVTAPATPAGPVDDITPREMEVLKLIGQGLSNKAIAERLFISERTVKTHVSNLLQKLDLDDRTNLAIYAIRQGLV